MGVLVKTAKRWKFNEEEFLSRLKMAGNLVKVEMTTVMSGLKEEKYVVVEIEE